MIRLCYVKGFYPVGVCGMVGGVWWMEGVCAPCPFPRVGPSHARKWSDFPSPVLAWDGHSGSCVAVSRPFGDCSTQSMG